MKRKLGLLLLIVCSLTLIQCSEDNETEETEKLERDSRLNGRVIYGDDNRLDLYQVNNSTLLRMADATVALVRPERIINNGNGTSRLNTRHFGEGHNLCQGEPFYNQHTLAFCSGFLVGEDLIVTAGHCIRQQTCANTKFVFGYALASAGGQPHSVSNSEVYSCDQVLHSEVNSRGADYAVVRLDRKVVGHQPLKIRRSGVVGDNASLVVIGHPSGLPTKVAGGANVRSVRSEHFVANLDTYGGNSGSAVFNNVTGEVEGILVRGETDYIWEGNCQRSNVCSNSGCRGEDVTKITEAVALIPPIDDVVDPDPEPDLGRVAYADDPNLQIPDNRVSGIVAEIEVDQAVEGREVRIGVDILHTWRGDLVVSVVAPNGVERVLHARAGRNLDNLNGIYGEDLESVDSLQSLSLSGAGVWKLKVSDRAFWDRGVLRSWQVEFVPRD